MTGKVIPLGTVNWLLGYCHPSRRLFFPAYRGEDFSFLLFEEMIFSFLLFEEYTFSFSLFERRLFLSCFSMTNFQNPKPDDLAPGAHLRRWGDNFPSHIKEGICVSESRPITAGFG